MPRQPDLLRRATNTVAAGMVGLVFVCPWLDTDDAMPAGAGRRAVRLFAKDSAVRQTTLFAAAGLFVTGQVFFRGRRQYP